MSEPRQKIGEIAAFLWSERTHQLADDERAPSIDVLMAASARFGGGHDDDSTVLGVGSTRREVYLHQPLDCAGGRGGIDMQGIGQIAHPPRGPLHKGVEGVHLPGVESILGCTEEVVAERHRARTAAQLDPRTTETHSDIAIGRSTEIDC